MRDATELYPRVPSRGGRATAFFAREGTPEGLDTLLGGGIHRGTSTVLMGPAGTGKSTNAAQFSPGELASKLRAHAERECRIVVIDSLNGYLSAMPEERFLAAHLHQLLSFLSRKGVATIITLAQHSFFGLENTVNVRYLADTVLLFRYFETAGRVKQALSVIKKRTGQHERTIELPKTLIPCEPPAGS